MDKKIFESYFEIGPKKEYIFKGNTLDCYIPRRYEDVGLMTIESDISTIGVMELYFDGNKYKTGFFLPAYIKISPTSIDTVVIDDERYLKVSLVKGDVFMRSVEIVSLEAIAYMIWNEFVYLGNIPRFMTYNDMIHLFDTLQKVTGLTFGVNPVIFSVIIAHLARDPENTDILYRLSKMTENPAFIPMRSVSQIAISTSARIIGSYLDEGITVSLLQDKPEESELENILRL